MPDKQPTIYIVGGLPRTGKTTVSERLSHSLRIQSIETDHIRLLFRTTPSSKISTDANNDIKVVTRKLRPRLESLIDAQITNQSDFIINGECIDPYMLSESPHHALFRSCFFGLDDAETAYTRIRNVAIDSDWTQRIDDEQLKQILDKYAKRSIQLARVCLELGLPYVDASKDFMHAQQEAYRSLVGVGDNFEGEVTFDRKGA